jgi:antitoxin ParD1/3/4
MSHVEKMSVALTTEMAAVVREAVASGEYESSSEVIREALKDWRRRRQHREQEAGELRRLWNEGLARGEGHYADMDAIKAEARRRLGVMTAREE